MLSEMSQGAPQQMMQGAMGSAFVDVRKRASELKLKESRHSYFVFARLAFEVRFFCRNMCPIRTLL